MGAGEGTHFDVSPRWKEPWLEGLCGQAHLTPQTRQVTQGLNPPPSCLNITKFMEHQHHSEKSGERKSRTNGKPDSDCQVEREFEIEIKLWKTFKNLYFSDHRIVDETHSGYSSKEPGQSCQPQQRRSPRTANGLDPERKNRMLCLSGQGWVDSTWLLDSGFWCLMWVPPGEEPPCVVKSAVQPGLFWTGCAVWRAIASLVNAEWINESLNFPGAFLSLAAMGK